jgi:hypothetical protein
MAGCRSLFLLSLSLVALSSARADYALTDLSINVNGTVTNNLGNPSTVSGLDVSGLSVGLTGTGLGSAIFTFNPGAAGTYFVDFFWDEAVGVPFWNEYGIVNGSPAAGVSYQIDDSFAGTIFPNFTNNSFDNANDLPGTTDNYAKSCSGSNCNGDVALGLGFSFTLTSKQEAILTLTGSASNPGGFYLEGVHPVDGSTSTEADFFLQGSELIQGSGGPPPPPPSPEPAGEALLGGGVLLAGVVLRKLRLKFNRPEAAKRAE